MKVRVADLAVIQGLADRRDALLRVDGAIDRARRFRLVMTTDSGDVECEIPSELVPDVSGVVRKQVNALDAQLRALGVDV